ncbi:transcriptional repressor [Brachymonas sp. G13]|uniref:Fur family transcriptional regulator n=1 Tax=Brachymonas wangyanguii TaxID=3130163 RepID=UPI00307EB690
MNTSAVQPTSPLPATRWAELVRARGLRATRDVLRVLLLLEASKAPETHESLMQALQADGSGQPVDRVTLYRVLDRLVQANLLTRIQDSGRTAHFTLAQSAPSGFFECEQCHSLTALPDDPQLPALLEQLNARLQQTGLRSTDITLSVHGLCHDCEEDSDKP